MSKARKEPITFLEFMTIIEPKNETWYQKQVRLMNIKQLAKHNKIKL